MEKRTALYDKHVFLGAKMVPFAGFDMPVQYSGVTEEPVSYTHLDVYKRQIVICFKFSVLEVKKQIICPWSYHLLIVSKASGYGSQVTILSGSSFGTSSVILSLIHI